ncbi:MAG TPA: fumarylacetoacetate hydrolase family protein [Acidimicrobiales bacterium]|nr:fumarylacetoacetate hydrolase family protein [Acidimicrobiales bacterium]
MSGFGPDALPYGVDDGGHTVVAWGDEVVDLTRLTGLDVDPEVFSAGSLRPFMELGADAWAATRRQLMDLVPAAPPDARRPRSAVRLVLPWEVGDYADFYASRQHVTNMGRMLRPGEDPLPPAWLHLPIGYHGRSGTVIVSGEPVYRPSGLIPGDPQPRYAPTGRLDVEVELGFVVGAPVARGQVIGAADAERHIFGVVLVNDWSARDIQAFEYRPLGPFLGKSFATSVSPWVLPLAALDPWRVDGPVQDPEPAPYLKTAEPRNFDIRLRLSVNGAALSTTTSAGLYWSASQQLAHLTANGAGVRVGDLFATGTISGDQPRTEGSLMELGGGSMWLADGDVVTIEGWCGDPGGDRWISLGELSAEVRPCPST